MKHLIAVACPIAFATLTSAQRAEPVPETAAIRVGPATVRVFADATASVQRVGDAAPAQLPAFDPRLHLRSGVFDPWAGGPRFAAALAAPAEAALFAVQAHTALLPEYRAALAAAGAEIVGYWPMSAYVVRARGVDPATLRGMPWVRWVGAVALGDKLHPDLHAVVVAAAQMPAERRRYDLLLARAGDRAETVAAITALGGDASSLESASRLVEAALTPAQLARVAALDTVLWVGPFAPVADDMNNARTQGGANYIEAFGGLTGQGMRAAVLEGLEQTHPDWTNPPLAQIDGVEQHGHCTAMIVGGNGSGSFLARGMMPDCQMVEASVYQWNGVPRYDVTRDSIDPLLPWRVMQATASWGSGLTLTYEARSAELDDALFDFDLPTTQSQSNTGNQDSRPEAWAKNVISVGGVRHLDNSNPTDDFWAAASIGPASDGRIKPDICAYNNLVLTGDLTGAAGYTSTDYYSNFGGTSAATPIVSGHLGLLQQMFTDGLFHNALPLPATAANRFANRPHMTTAKALLTNTAASYSFAGLAHNLTRTHQGWGFPDLRRAFDNRDAMVVVDEYDVLPAGGARTYYVWVRPGTAQFRATMTHADPAALPAAAIHRINSLDLRVERFADGTFWWGNNGLDVGNTSQSGGVANDRDTLEQVWLTVPPGGIYTVTVSAPTLVQDGHAETPQVDADYALVMHPVGGGYHRQGPMQLDLVATTPGQLDLQVTGAPAAGWTEGFTFFSFATGGPRGFGAFFGIERDFLTDASLNEPAVVGSPLHFPNAGASSYPFTPFSFPPGLILALSGVTVDAHVTLFDASGQIVEQTRAERVTLQ
ncbi:MAG: S8 family serine peptidase [Planctomycetota bacterium]